jgi:hypothetical protein
LEIAKDGSSTSEKQNAAIKYYHSEMFKHCKMKKKGGFYE